MPTPALVTTSLMRGELNTSFPTTARGSDPSRVPASSSNEIDHDDGVVEVPSFGPSRRINPLDGTVRPANGSASRAVVGTADVEVGPTTSVPAGWEVPHAARPTAPTATIAANLVTLRRTPGSVATFPFS
jgi:hypothetical protein